MASSSKVSLSDELAIVVNPVSALLEPGPEAISKKASSLNVTLPSVVAVPMVVIPPVANSRVACPQSNVPSDSAGCAETGCAAHVYEGTPAGPSHCAVNRSVNVE